MHMLPSQQYQLSLCTKAAKQKSTVAFYQPAKTFIAYIGIEHFVIFLVFRTMNTMSERVIFSTKGYLIDKMQGRESRVCKTQYYVCTRYCHNTPFKLLL